MIECDDILERSSKSITVTLFHILDFSNFLILKIIEFEVQDHDNSIKLH